MSLYRHPKSSYWWCRFTIGGREVRQSTGTKERPSAEKYEHKLRGRYWSAIRLGEEHHTWKEARERWLRERAAKRSLKRDIGILGEYEELDPVAIRDIDAALLAQLRASRERAISVQSGKIITAATVNREFALLRAILLRATRAWGWLDHAPAVPMARLELPDPRFATRAQIERLAKKLPKHSGEMVRFAVATGLRRANVTGLTWDRVDLKAGFAYIPGSQAKAGRGIPVPLNADAVAVLKRRRKAKKKHPTRVFSYRGRPIEQVTTRRWRRDCTAVGLPGFRFHDLRHTWASWQAQAGTPAYVLRELGGWQSEAMVKRYAHLGGQELRAFADRSLMKVGTPAKVRRRARFK